MRTVYKGITWDHPRGINPLLRAGDELRREGPVIEWDARPLSSFEDTDIRVLAKSYDFIAIDHPHLGVDGLDEALLPLESLVSSDHLELHHRESLGATYSSYWQGGHLWALPLDAAAQVSACAPAIGAELREAQRESRSVTLEDIRELVGEIGRERCAVAASPTHLISMLLTIYGQRAQSLDELTSSSERRLWDYETGPSLENLQEAFNSLQEIMSLMSAESYRLDPIKLLEAMSVEAKFDYAPLVYGYVNYGMEPRRRPVEFVDAPTFGNSEGGSLLGGVGLAVSKRMKCRPDAKRYLDHVTGYTFQVKRMTQSGGQPALQAAWMDIRNNEQTKGFYKNTIRTLQNGTVRPATRHYPTFQEQGGRMLHQAMVNGETNDVHVKLYDFWGQLHDK